MTCEHPNAHPELPCPWPGCPAGTPQQAVVLMKGDQGELHVRRGVGLRVEAEEGVELWRRRPCAAGWEWERQGGA